MNFNRIENSKCMASEVFYISESHRATVGSLSPPEWWKRREKNQFSCSLLAGVKIECLIACKLCIFSQRKNNARPQEPIEPKTKIANMTLGVIKLWFIELEINDNELCSQCTTYLRATCVLNCRTLWQIYFARFGFLTPTNGRHNYDIFHIRCTVIKTFSCMW